jgi:hypothetical protein
MMRLFGCDPSPPFERNTLPEVRVNLNLTNHALCCNSYCNGCMSSPACDISNFLFLANQAKLVLVLIPSMCRQFGVHASTLRVRSQRTTKEKNVGFRAAVIGRQKMNELEASTHKCKKTNKHTRVAFNAKGVPTLIKIAFV